MLRLALYVMIGFGVAIGYSDRIDKMETPEVSFAVTVAAWPILVSAELARVLKDVD